MVSDGGGVMRVFIFPFYVYACDVCVRMCVYM